MASNAATQIPVINLQPLIANTQARYEVAAQIQQACCDCGFFYITGHGIDETLQQRLEELSRQFFAQDLEAKLKISMTKGGRAWRGYFPVGDELTSGKPDMKEGLYLGTELGDNHPLVQASIPLHGRNLFPDYPPQFRETILDYIKVMTQLGHQVMSGIALSLDLEPSYFFDYYTWEPLILFRIFNYPMVPYAPEQWGVGEHTDYGLLTILKQDDSGGLQVKSKSGWIDAPPISNSFICNIGDMLDLLTGGFYCSTPHRVRNLANHDRLSFPFFFDPNFAAEVKPIPQVKPELTQNNLSDRWDHANIHAFQGTYGDYILSKVSKVFPALRQSVL